MIAFRAERREALGIWHVLRQKGQDIARCIAERLMRAFAITGVACGKQVITTDPDMSFPFPDNIGVFQRKGASGEPAA